MKKLRKKIRDMSIRKKIVFYMYIVLIPLLLLICAVVTVYRYQESRCSVNGKASLPSFRRRSPHFLFNALDSIYWQALNEEDEQTAESIYELAQLFRLVLGEGKSMETVEMRLQLLKRYLEIQKLRFHEQMNYHFHVDSSVLQFKIPRLILQPFVENEVVHGMQNNISDFEITVTVKKDGDFITFLIRDNGIG